MKIYTKSGDKGNTSLWGGRRVPKSSARVDAYGQVDELNSYLGLIDSELSSLGKDNSNLSDLYKQILRIQSELFVLGSDLSTPLDYDSKGSKQLRCDEDMISRLETEIDVWDANLQKLTNFVLPGGHKLAAQAHYARTICRRAERGVVQLAAQENINELAIQYLNRLSDWLFILARSFNFWFGQEERIWVGKQK